MTRLRMLYSGLEIKQIAGRPSLEGHPSPGCYRHPGRGKQPAAGSFPVMQPKPVTSPVKCRVTGRGLYVLELQRMETNQRKTKPSIKILG